MAPRSRNTDVTGTMALIQARMRSRRLPGKVLLPLQGIPVLEVVIGRVKQASSVDTVVVVTSVEPENDILARVAEKCGVPFFRGSEDDVLDRYYRAAVHFDARHIVRLTADCPLIDPGIIDDVVRYYHAKSADLVSNQLTDSYPDGMDVCVFSREALELAWTHAVLPSEREHVAPWIIAAGAAGEHGLSAALDYPCETDLSRERWTLDESADYRFLEALSNHIPGSILDIGWRDVLALLDRHPDIAEINRHIIRNEGYLKSLQEDRAHADII